jgi:hypothetical protein
MGCRYTKRKDGEVFKIPNSVEYKLACCDCGLVHKIVIMAPDVPEGQLIGFSATRDNRATAQRRRRLKQKEK